MLEITVHKAVRQYRGFYVRKYCSDYAIFEIIDEGDKRFERKVANDIKNKTDAEIMTAALAAAEGRE